MNGLLLTVFVLLAQLSTPVGSVQGVISKFGSEAPISGARVELIRTDGSTPQSYSAITDPDGTFVISNARPGQYRLAASRTGYLSREFGQRSRNGFGMMLTVEANQQLRNLDIALRPASSISGRVTDRSGDPMVSAEVRAMTPAYQNGQRILRVVQTTVTNDLGEYRLFALPEGQYYVSVAPSSDIGLTTLVVSPSTAGTTIINSGVPTASDRRPRIAVYYPSTGDSRIATPIDLTSGADFAGVNITFVPSQPHHIRGNVPGGTARVTLVPADPGLAAFLQQADASNGPFDLANVSPGEYTLVARSGELLGTIPVSLGDGDLDNVTVGMSPSVSVPTRVSFEDRTPGEMDMDLEDVNFTLIAVPPIPGGDPEVYGPFSNGFLAFGVLLRQDYRIALRSVRSSNQSTRLRDVYIKSIRMGNRDVLNDGFRVDDPASMPQIEIVLGLRSGTLSGNVVSEKQKPEANATVLLVPEAGRRRWPDSLMTVNTDLAGRFTIGRIPPGDYIALSWEEVDDGAWTDPEFLKKYEERGKRVRVNAGGNPAITITAIP